LEELSPEWKSVLAKGRSNSKVQAKKNSGPTWAFKDGAPVEYAVMDGDPLLYNERGGEAWIFLEGWGAWRQANTAEVFMNVRCISKTHFEDWFPSLPPPPSDAFVQVGAAAAPIRYGGMDGPVVFKEPTEAWAFKEGAWRQADCAVVAMNASVLPKHAFAALFTGLPPLPDHAFRSEPTR
jgi:hypothetical protein